MTATNRSSKTLDALVREIESLAQPLYGLDDVRAARVMMLRGPRRDGTLGYCAVFGFDPLCSLLVGEGATPNEALARLLREVRESQRTLLSVAARAHVIATIHQLAQRFEAGAALAVPA